MKRSGDPERSLPSKKFKKKRSLFPNACFWHETIPKDGRDTVRSFLDARSLSALACASREDMVETGKGHQETLRNVVTHLRANYDLFFHLYPRIFLDVAFGHCTPKIEELYQEEEPDDMILDEGAITLFGIALENVAALYGHFSLLMQIRAYADANPHHKFKHSSDIVVYAGMNGHCGFIKSAVAAIPGSLGQATSHALTEVALMRGHVDILRYQFHLGVEFSEYCAEGALRYARYDVLDFFINACNVRPPIAHCAYNPKYDMQPQPFDDKEHLTCLLFLCKDPVDWDLVALEALENGHEACLCHALRQIKPSDKLIHRAIRYDNVTVLERVSKDNRLRPFMLRYAIDVKAVKCIEFLISEGIRIELVDLWYLAVESKGLNFDIDSIVKLT